MTAPTTNAAFYADFKSLAALKRDARANDPAALRAAAQQFESLFTDMMLKSMRAASFGDALTGSDETDMYQGMFDQQLAMQMSKGKGLGLADMLVQQLTRSGLTPRGKSDAVGNAVEAKSAVNEISNPQPQGAPQTGLQPEFGPTGADTHSAGITSTNWPPATPQEFVRSLLPHAELAARTLGVDPATLVAHAALETGWGKHVPCNADGSSSFNLFGIKATPAWRGQIIGASTVEFEQDVAVKRVERFKAYDSPADCFADYASLLGGASRYAGTRNSGANAAQFANSLQQGGYATDPDYASKLRHVAGAVRAIQLDAVQVTSSRADI
jgi:peptidoglycan hydrolase FlgJ